MNLHARNQDAPNAPKVAAPAAVAKDSKQRREPNSLMRYGAAVAVIMLLFGAAGYLSSVTTTCRRHGRFASSRSSTSCRRHLRRRRKRCLNRR